MISTMQLLYLCSISHFLLYLMEYRRIFVGDYPCKFHIELPKTNVESFDNYASFHSTYINAKWVDVWK